MGKMSNWPAINGIVLQVEVRVGRPYVRKYKAKGLMPHGPAELTFFNEAENREMTVAQHYEQLYKMGCGISRVCKSCEH